MRNHNNIDSKLTTMKLRNFIDINSSLKKIKFLAEKIKKKKNQLESLCLTMRTIALEIFFIF